jgi:hypothetical protein
MHTFMVFATVRAIPTPNPPYQLISIVVSNYRLCIIFIVYLDIVYILVHSKIMHLEIPNGPII